MAGRNQLIIEDLYKFLEMSYLLPFAKQAVKSHIQPEPQEIKWDKVLDGEIVPKLKSRHSWTFHLFSLSFQIIVNIMLGVAS